LRNYQNTDIIMLLEILIPTYNRIDSLKKNIEVLSKIVRQLNASNYISILISDNCSSDSTESEIKNIVNKCGVTIKYYRQKTNIGYLGNFKYLISRCDSDYFMLLGDDDYPNREYLERSIKLIKSDTSVSCILPAFQAIDENGKIMNGVGRDLNCKEKRWPKGYNNLYENSLRAHQISGIIIKNKGIKDMFEKACVQNLYPQIYLTGLACLKGDTIHIPEYPIKVTQTSKKYWSYDKTGLLCDIFENYAKLGISQMQRFKCETKFISEQSWRIMHDSRNLIKQLINICVLSFNGNTSVIGHFIHPFTIMVIWMKYLLRYCERKI